MMAFGRDTYKYNIIVAGMIVHSGITKDLEVTKKEIRKRWDKFEMEVVGKKSVWSVAVRWLRHQPTTIANPVKPKKKINFKGLTPEQFEQVRDALIEAKETIKIWHNMANPRDRSGYKQDPWSIYDTMAPEMQRINKAIETMKS